METNNKKYIKEIIECLANNTDENVLDNIIIPFIKSKKFTVNDSLELLNKCPEIIELIGSSDESIAQSTLFDAYNILMDKSIKLVDDFDIKSYYANKRTGNTDLDYIKLYLMDVAKYPLLNFTQTTELFKKLRDENGIINEEIMNEIVKHNLKLVIFIAKRYVEKGLPFLDIIQEGNIGLMKAVKKYDYKKGYRFSTYATWWIKQAIKRGLAYQSKTIRIPDHMVEILNKIKKCENELSLKFGRRPTLNEIADLLNISYEKLLEYKKYSRKIIYLDDYIRNSNNSEDETISNYIVYTDYNLESCFDKLYIESIFNSSVLNKKEIKVIILRYGLFGQRKYTLEEIGKMYHLTKGRIGHIEKKALIKLRDWRNFENIKNTAKCRIKTDSERNITYGN